jgi:hypothetical protein
MILFNFIGRFRFTSLSWKNTLFILCDPPKAYKPKEGKSLQDIFPSHVNAEKDIRKP